MEYLEIGEEIMDEARLSLGKALNDNIYISMVNHIYTAVVRAKDDILVKNALLWDIQRFYKEEYQIVKKALEIIEKKTGVLLPNDEAGFIALHIVNGQLDEDVHDMYEITKIMQEIENIVRYRFKIEFNEESAYYYRFITHLKFFAQRLVEYKKNKTSKKMFFESNLCSNDKKRQKLVYINDDLFNGTFKRIHTRDYRCTRELSNEFVEKGLLE